MIAMTFIPVLVIFLSLPGSQPGSFSGPQKNPTSKNQLTRRKIHFLQFHAVTFAPFLAIKVAGTNFFRQAYGGRSHTCG